MMGNIFSLSPPLLFFFLFFSLGPLPKAGVSHWRRYGCSTLERISPGYQDQSWSNAARQAGKNALECRQAEAGGQVCRGTQDTTVGTRPGMHSIHVKRTAGNNSRGKDKPTLVGPCAEVVKVLKA